MKAAAMAALARGGQQAMSAVLRTRLGQKDGAQVAQRVDQAMRAPQLSADDAMLEEALDDEEDEAEDGGDSAARGGAAAQAAALVPARAPVEHSGRGEAGGGGRDGGRGLPGTAGPGRAGDRPGRGAAGGRDEDRVGGRADGQSFVGVGRPAGPTAHPATPHHQQQQHQHQQHQAVMAMQLHAQASALAVQRAALERQQMLVAGMGAGMAGMAMAAAPARESAGRPAAAAPAPAPVRQPAGPPAPSSSSSSAAAAAAGDDDESAWADDSEPAAVPSLAALAAVDPPTPGGKHGQSSSSSSSRWDGGASMTARAETRMERAAASAQARALRDPKLAAQRKLADKYISVNASLSAALEEQASLLAGVRQRLEGGGAPGGSREDLGRARAIAGRIDELRSQVQAAIRTLRLAVGDTTVVGGEVGGGAEEDDGAADDGEDRQGGDDEAAGEEGAEEEQEEVVVAEEEAAAGPSAEDLAASRSWKPSGAASASLMVIKGGLPDGGVDVEAIVTACGGRPAVKGVQDNTTSVVLTYEDSAAALFGARKGRAAYGEAFPAIFAPTATTA